MSEYPASRRYAAESRPGNSKECLSWSRCATDGQKMSIFGNGKQMLQIAGRMNRKQMKIEMAMYRFEDMDIFSGVRIVGSVAGGNRYICEYGNVCVCLCCVPDRVPASLFSRYS